MRTQHRLQILFIFIATMATTQVMATGLSYDPYENYYRDYYGIDAEEITRQAMAKADITSPEKIDSVSTDITEDDISEYADPSNFYNW